LSLGFTEILLLLVIILIFFGVGKLPNVMGDLGKGIRNFKAGLKDGPEAPVQPPSDNAPPKILTNASSGEPPAGPKA